MQVCRSTEKEKKYLSNIHKNKVKNNTLIDNTF